MSGTFDEIQEHFHRQLWTDGLPIVPPTRERVDAFLEFTDRKPDDVMRVLPQEGREGSILSIAVTGVMAGCRPEYMPVLIAIIEAMCDPNYRVEDSGSTPGWEPVVIVSGPIVKELDFNSGQGMMRFGRQANTSIGRFVRMYLRNICGFRIPPGAGDKGSIGQSFLVAMAEDEDSAREIGWPTYARGPRLRGGRKRRHGAQRGQHHVADVQRRRRRERRTCSNGPMSSAAASPTGRTPDSKPVCGARSSSPGPASRA